jgi:hypothetical protein
MDGTDALVFAIVVGGRLGIPLFIPRFPLPAIVAAMLLDAADQSIFQQLTDLNLDNYQSYDKALDVYYLAIAYIATMRNWSNIFAYKTGRFLWYYRLVGVMLFELLNWRALLLIFPNTFEYFFDWYEALKLRWKPARLTRRGIIGAAAFIWIFIKLPQEYWIHIANLDTTDLIKEDILGVPADTPWGEALSENLWVFPVLIAIGVGIFLLVRWLWPKLPPADWKMSFDADAHPEERPPAAVPGEALPSVWHGLIEKIALVALISIIFGQMLPNVDVSNLQMAVGVAVVIVVNAFASHWLAQRGTHWRNILIEFAAMAAINLGAALAFTYLAPSFDSEIQLRGILFFVLLITLIVTLYDRYRPILDRRLAAEQAQKPETGDATTPA